MNDPKRSLRQRRAPEQRVLLAVTGLSPQIVTETLYALAVQARSPWVPTEVQVITTQRGASLVASNLLDRRRGWFHRLVKDYGLSGIRFDEDSVHLIRLPDGTALEDIRNDEHNRIAGDAIANRVRELTADDNLRLHASIAGGRKTMGFYLGYAMSLFGREHDRLSHVLVSPPYESHPDFYYPSRSRRLIGGADGKAARLDASKASVWLGDIPFVRLRKHLPLTMLHARAGFESAVRAAQQGLEPRMTLHLNERRVVTGQHELRLPPAEFALLFWFADRARKGMPGIEAPAGRRPSREHARDYLEAYRRIAEGDERVRSRYLDGMSKDAFLERLSKLRRALIQALGHAQALPYLVMGEGRRPMRYRLMLPAGAIRIE